MMGCGNFCLCVISNEVWNLSGFETQKKEGFLTSFGMTIKSIFSVS